MRGQRNVRVHVGVPPSLEPAQGLGGAREDARDHHRLSSAARLHLLGLTDRPRVAREVHLLVLGPGEQRGGVERVRQERLERAGSRDVPVEPRVLTRLLGVRVRVAHLRGVHHEVDLVVPHERLGRVGAAADDRLGPETRRGLERKGP